MQWWQLKAKTLIFLWILCDRQQTAENQYYGNYVVELEAKNCDGARITSTSSMMLTHIAFYATDKTFENTKKMKWFVGKGFAQGFFRNSWHLVSFERKKEYYLDETATFFITALRLNEMRKNDNPTSHLVYDSNTRKTLTSYPKTGEGVDFSRMYYEDPFRPSRIFITFNYDNGTKKSVLDWYAPNDCFATGTWIANEGMYFLDVEANEWIPVYFDYSSSTETYLI